MQVKYEIPDDLIRTANSLDKARGRYILFLKNAISGGPEYNRYNTKRTREEGKAFKPLTKAIYPSLIDMPPAEYDTMLTSFLQIKRLTEKIGQSFKIFTVDQQLHRYAIEILWAFPERFPFNISIVRLAGN